MREPPRSPVGMISVAIVLAVLAFISADRSALGKGGKPTIVFSAERCSADDTLCASFIYRVASDGTGRRRLARGEAPAWSPSGAQIAFRRDGAVFVMSATGGQPKRIARGNGHSAPSWSPDGKDLVFASGRGIARIDVNGMRVRLLTHERTDTAPIWSPTSQAVVFLRETPCKLCVNRDIWIIRADRGLPRNLTQSPTDDGDPAWSPDGRWFAFVRQDDDLNSAIWTMKSDGTNKRRLSPRGQNTDDSPSWSPNGRRLVFATLSGLRTMDKSGGVQQPLTRNQDDESPSWSPDGRTVAFTRFGSVETIPARGSSVSKSVARRYDVISRPSWLPGR